MSHFFIENLYREKYIDNYPHSKYKTLYMLECVLQGVR